METSDIVTEAARRAGVADVTNGSWRVGLDALVRAIKSNKLLNEFGHKYLYDLFANSLANRMRVDDYIGRHPEVLDKPVVRPVFILGMPRTGTTMLSHLMASDPQRRCLLRWEAYEPVPPAAPGMLTTDPRCLAALEADKTGLMSDPELKKRHFETAVSPTECIYLLGQDFRSLLAEVIFTAPVYSDWILFCDMTSAYEHRKRVLQILQSTNPGLWTLKMPSDGLFVRTLLRTFPDARIIWTHRNPYAVLGSVFGLRGQVRRMFNSDPDAVQMRRTIPLQLTLHAQRPLELSQERPEIFFHSYFNDMLANPIAQMRNIYEWLGDDFTPTAQSGIAEWLRLNPRGQFGKHEYSLDEWGLSREDAGTYFHDYVAAHPRVLEGG